MTLPLLCILLICAIPVAFWLGTRERYRAPARASAHLYRSAPAAISAEEGSDARAAWDAGVAAERARVLTIVETAREAAESGVARQACAAIRKVAIIR